MPTGRLEDHLTTWGAPGVKRFLVPGLDHVGALPQPFDVVLEICDIVLEPLDMVRMTALVFRLVEDDLAHELAEIVEAMLDAAETLVGLIETLVRLIEAIVGLIQALVGLIEARVEVSPQCTNAVANLAQDLDGQVSGHLMRGP